MYKINCFIFTLFLSFAGLSVAKAKNKGISGTTKIIRHDGQRVIIEDKDGHKVGEIRINGKIVATKTYHKYFIVATRHSGIFLYRLNWRNKLIKVNHVMVKHPIKDIRIDDDYLFVITAFSKYSTWVINGSSIKKWKKGNSISKPKDNIDKKLFISGKVISVRRGLVVVNIGKNDGLALGDHLSINSRQMRANYDPLKNKTVLRASNRVVAILEIIQIKSNFSVLKLGPGDDVHKGDAAYFTRKSIMTSKKVARRWPGMKSLSLLAFPGFLLGDYSLSLLGQFDYHFEIPTHLSLHVRPWIFNSIQAYDASLRAAYENKYFEFGVGFAGLYAFNKDNSGDKYSDGVVFFETYVRLGGADTGHFSLGIKSLINDSSFNGLWLQAQLPGKTHFVSFNYDMSIVPLNIQDAPDAGDNSQSNSKDIVFIQATVMDKIRLWGNGGPGSLFLPIYAGLHMITGDIDSLSSFIMGAGIEYRW